MCCLEMSVKMCESCELDAEHEVMCSTVNRDLQ